MPSETPNEQVGTRDRLTYLARPRAGQEAELDLDRIVWDQEYRNAVRHLFRNKG